MAKKSYRVSLEVPDGVNDWDMRQYIEESVATMKGCLCPEDPMFHLKGESVKVFNINKSKRK